jgi:glutathione S-transferase
MLKILGAPHSRAFRVIWLANELGIPYEHFPVTFSVPNAQCKEPWYLALNPNGLVPAIDDGGFVMWETAAINLYLAETYKNSLYPSTPQCRGRMLQWTFFATTEVEPALITLFRNRIFFSPDQRNETLAVQAEQTYARSWRSLRVNSPRPRFSAVIHGTWQTLWLRACCMSSPV